MVVRIMTIILSREIKQLLRHWIRILTVLIRELMKWNTWKVAAVRNRSVIRSTVNVLKLGWSARISVSVRIVLIWIQDSTTTMIRTSQSKTFIYKCLTKATGTITITNTSITTTTIWTLNTLRETTIKNRLLGLTILSSSKIKSKNQIGESHLNRCSIKIKQRVCKSRIWR